MCTYNDGYRERPTAEPLCCIVSFLLPFDVSETAVARRILWAPSPERAAQLGETGTFERETKLMSQHRN